MKTDTFQHFFNETYKDVINTSRNNVPVTRFGTLDKVQFLRPGIYVLCAPPSTGKSTFMWQLGEQLAETGENVLFLSYEMSLEDLFFKSIARELRKFLMVENNNTDILTATDLKLGKTNPYSNKILKVLQAKKLKLYAYECFGNMLPHTLEEIKSKATDKSIVIIDYLQNIPNNKATAKLDIDDNLLKLQEFQKKTNSVMLIISSLSRSGYKNGKSYETLKESGNIEYCADVIWRLEELPQPKIDEDKRKLDEFKREMGMKVDPEILQPRICLLKSLKNRFGSRYEIEFDYYADSDLFLDTQALDEEWITLVSQEVEKAWNQL